MFFATGRERGYFKIDEIEIPLDISASRIFILVNTEWKQIHHHGSIDNPELLRTYQEAVKPQMISQNVKFACITGLIVTSYITFILVAINIGFVNTFIIIWMRSWLIAFLLDVPSLLFVGPFIRDKIKN